METLIAKHVESTIRSGVMVETNREIHALILTTKEKLHATQNKGSGTHEYLPEQERTGVANFVPI